MLCARKPERHLLKCFLVFRIIICPVHVDEYFFLGNSGPRLAFELFHLLGLLTNDATIHIKVTMGSRNVPLVLVQKVFPVTQVTEIRSAA